MKYKLNKQIIGYTAFGLIMLAVFLYLRFPGRVISDYITAMVSARHPEAVLFIGTLNPDFPPGVKMENIACGLKKNPTATMNMNSLNARIGLLDVFKGETTLFFKGNTYGGGLEGRINFAHFMSLSKPVHFEIRLNNLGLDQCAYLKELLKHQIAGTLTGAFVYRYDYERKGAKNGEGEFTLSNGSYPLRERLLGFEKIDFTRIEGKIAIKNNALKIDRIKMMGPEFNCTLQGDITLNEDIESSTINMNGTIEIAGSGTKRMKVAIGGILGNPTVRLM
ncbi:MAG: type II secretion system protein GspN [Deltaproteobacteria bacterium]|nr:type II secretion system protein GspN [Deltaproteobacteria bacterium]